MKPLRMACRFPARVPTFIASAALTALLILASMPVTVLGAGTQVNPQDDALEQIWAARSADLADFIAEADDLRTRAENLASPLENGLRATRAQFVRLSGLFHASRGHPTEQLTVVQQMRGIRTALGRSMQPLREIAATINQRLAEIDALKHDLDGLTLSSAAEGLGSTAGSEGLGKFTRDLDATRRTLNSASTRLQRILAPAEIAAQRFDASITSIEQGLPKTWEDYYLTPSGNAVSDLTSAPLLLTEWAQSLDSRMGFAYPRTLSEWFDAAVKFTVAALIMALLGYAGLRGLWSLPARWRKAGDSIIRNAWVWMGAGFSLLAAANNEKGGIYFAFVLCGSLTLIWGIAAMAWRLRVAVLPGLENKPSPVKRLFLPAAFGIVMLFSDLPTRILGIVWGAVVLVFLVRLYIFIRQEPVRKELPMLERVAFGCALAFGALSLLVAVAGYARLAILTYTLLFALVNTITLGNALVALFAAAAARRINKETSPVLRAVVDAVSIPAGWILSLVFTLPWLWAIPGANYMLLLVTSTHYDLGIASFDFSKLLLIAVLFFVCRSLSGAGKVYLDHLPDRIPNVEAGVIPPLRVILVYGIWVLFGIVTLTLVGVNLTSLAVVAGGLSVGIGFGMQNLFNNLVSGIILIFGRSILVGDVVDLPGASGTVEAINIRSTVIRTADRAQIFVPNSTLMSAQFINWTRNGRMVRKSVDVGVAYGTDTARVQTLLLEIAAAQPHVRKAPAPTAAFVNFGASSLDFTLYVFIDNVDNAFSTQSAIRHEINRVFAEQGIEIPFPQMDVHVPGAGAESASVSVQESAEKPEGEERAVPVRS
ncbi:mechanosensitive ion channel [Desulfovibrio sp. OttesenSCG-928-I05]|nr:mechanosensitive ion channel [Desulfovibrio sp. OttesenSCG-928-I05]